MNRARKALLACGAAIAIAMTAPPALAQQRMFDVAAQPATRSIPEFARQAGIQIVAPGSRLRGIRTPALRGNYDVRQALAILLRGSGLRIIADEGSTITLGSAVPGEEQAGGAAADDESADQEIVVTGTNIRGAPPVGSQIVRIDRAEIDRNGYTTAAEIVRSLPQNFAGGVAPDTVALISNASIDSAGGSNSNRGTALNLRGLGASSTLTLLNGRRLAPSGTVGAYSDVSNIPASAIERVEILPDGASAIYGSDAVGGVVNYILRTNYNGAETRLSVGSVTEGSLREVQAGQTFGRSWNGGSALMAVEYYRQEEMRAGDRAEFSGDYRRFGGPDVRARVCNPGTLSVGGQTFALTPGSGPLVANTANSCSTLRRLTIYPDVERYNLLGTVQQDVSDSIHIDANISYARNNQTTSAGSNITSVTVPSTNPFYINPLSTTAPVTVSLDPSDQLGERLLDYRTEQFTAGGAITARLSPEWEVKAFAALASETLSRREEGGVDATSLAAALAASSPTEAFNPFSRGQATNETVLQRLKNSQQGGFEVDSSLISYGVIANGTMLSLPGGDVRIAVGGEIRRQRFEAISTSSFVLRPSANSTSINNFPRTVRAAFAEIQVPVFGAGNGVPGVRALTLSFAARVEDYSDAGSVVAPRAGFEWIPFHGLRLRSSYSQSFRAPLPDELGGRANNVTILNIVDSTSPTGRTVAFLYSGPNSELEPETAKSFTAGLDLTPDFLRGFQFGATYFRINYQNRILSPRSPASFQDPTFFGVLNRSPTRAEQESICANPTTNFIGNFSTTPGSCADTAIGAIVDTRTTNVANVTTSGLDLIGSYIFSLGHFQINLSASATYVFEYVRDVGSAVGPLDIVDTVGNVPDFRLRSRLSVTRGRVTAAVSYNYFDSYRDIRRTPIRPVSSFSSFDLNLSYDAGSPGGWLHGIRLNLNIQNMFDARLPFVNNDLLNAGYDIENFDVRGRFVRLGLLASW